MSTPVDKKVKMGVFFANALYDQIVFEIALESGNEGIVADIIFKIVLENDSFAHTTHAKKTNQTQVRLSATVRAVAPGWGRRVAPGFRKTSGK